MTDTQKIIVSACLILLIFSCVAVRRFLRHQLAQKKKREEERKKRIRDKDELILHVTALLKQEPTAAGRTDPYTIVLHYGSSRIVHRRKSWDDLIMLVYADESYVSIQLINGSMRDIPLTNKEEWQIRDIRHALRKWERLPQPQPT